MNKPLQPSATAGEASRGTKPNYWGRTLASFFLVLFAMPLGHALMIIMERTLSASAVHSAGFIMGFVGLVMVIVGVVVKSDTRQTLWGLFGGLLFWTGWVEFLFLYYARRYGVQPEMENGMVVTKPEYLIMPATFGLWMMVMTMYIFSTKNGCNFITWIQKVCFRSHRPKIVVQPMTRHTSIVTFMELNMMLWALYLLLMFCYDKHFLGDHHPVTFLVGLGCFIGALFMFRRQLKLASWGANIRMAIATVIIFWTPVEILGRINFFTEIWLQPERYTLEMCLTLLVFVALAIYLWIKSGKKRNKVAAIWLILLLMTGSVTASAKDKRVVTRGMSKQEVTEILGKPSATSFDEYGEQWEYRKVIGGLLDSRVSKILVDFNRNDRVVRYRTVDLPSSDEAKDAGRHPMRPYDGGMVGDVMPYPYDIFCLNETDFSWLYNKVKKASFDSDKYSLLEVATLGCYYTCNQCARLMELFSFSDERLKALKLMSRHIVDPENAYSIYRVFTFDSDKDKAADMMQNARRR